MKAFCLIVILLLLVPAYGARAALTDRNDNLRESAAYWPEDFVVHVYFVQNLFTAGEKQLLWNAMETWSQRAGKKGLAISFVLAGETGGLIDCVGCLTIARQDLAAGGTRQRVSFNALRQDQTGKLISAWIGFDRATASQLDLRTLMLQALERGLGPTYLQTAKSGRP
jgi:hypothetical protein